LRDHVPVTRENVDAEEQRCRRELKQHCDHRAGNEPPRSVVEKHERQYQSERGLQEQRPEQKSGGELALRAKCKERRGAARERQRGDVTGRDERVKRRERGTDGEALPAIAMQRGKHAPDRIATSAVDDDGRSQPAGDRNRVRQARERCEEHRNLRPIHRQKTVLILGHQSVHSRGLLFEAVELLP